MFEFLFTFVFLLLVVTAMAVGVMRGRQPISGTCGGLNNIGLDGACDICGGDPNKCETPDGSDANATGNRGRFFDAS